MFTVLQEGETPFNNEVVIPTIPPMDTEPTVQEQALTQPSYREVGVCFKRVGDIEVVKHSVKSYVTILSI
jgi:hypothetical protein